tara:strand:+ start:660 stop:1397 length:738 start_codon:yes stop_codon:yes gene_type:complete
MLTKRLFLFTISILPLVALFSSCEGALFSSGEEDEKIVAPKISEGVIHFELTYPYYQDAFMASIMPDEMEMTFKNNIYRNHVTKGGLFSSTVIADCNNETLILILDLGPKRIYCALDKSLTDNMLVNYPVPDILKVNEFDSIADAFCEKKIAIFDYLADGYDVELYETVEIDIKNSNWCNQYSEIEGVLLGYEIKQFGIQARMIATKMESVAVNDSIFNVPQGFKEVTLEKMLFEMDEISKSFSY